MPESFVESLRANVKKAYELYEKDVASLHKGGGISPLLVFQQTALLIAFPAYIFDAHNIRKERDDDAKRAHANEENMDRLNKELRARRRAVPVKNPGFDDPL